MPGMRSCGATALLRGRNAPAPVAGPAETPGGGHRVALANSASARSCSARLSAAVQQHSVAFLEVRFVDWLENVRTLFEVMSYLGKANAGMRCLLKLCRLSGAICAWLFVGWA
ncbi:hypothetical protein HPP92_006841 [Vanilla planifolia]|uniref:Uncharacterized protein n=1 Tax=Vanilla planifolia TaxID=51239 RepID=A0A835RPN0_VANPL|nr:hypothetical protein HPP92_006841 [Vanilla planifolia]